MKIIFLGPQGSGKSTQAKMLADYLSVPYVEMGQLLRDKMNDTDQDAKVIRTAMETGTLVADNKITIRTLNQRLSKPDYAKGFILDGYPRNDEQVRNLPEGIDMVFYINIPDDEAVERLLKRGRTDDTPEVIRKRLETYHQETEPILSYFKQKGILAEIDGTPSIEEVDADIKMRIKKTIASELNDFRLWKNFRILK